MAVLGRSEVLSKIAQFAARVSEIGVVNSLSQLVVKLTGPGVPDIYQGTEFWDLSLVDPDNRAPVDFAVRKLALDSLDELEPNDLTDPRIKQFIARTNSCSAKGTSRSLREWASGRCKSLALSRSTWWLSPSSYAIPPRLQFSAARSRI